MPQGDSPGRGWNNHIHILDLETSTWSQPVTTVSPRHSKAHFQRCLEKLRWSLLKISSVTLFLSVWSDTGKQAVTQSSSCLCHSWEQGIRVWWKIQSKEVNINQKVVHLFSFHDGNLPLSCFNLHLFCTTGLQIEWPVLHKHGHLGMAWNVSS